MSDAWQQLPRRKIRYWLYRIQKEADGGPSAADCPEGLREYFEDHPDFLGWRNFAITWDVGGLEPYDHAPTPIEREEGFYPNATPFEIFRRDTPVYRQWVDRLQEVVPELPVKEKTDDGSEGNI